MTTRRPHSIPAHAEGRRYLAEVRIPIEGRQDLSWIGRGLHAACGRLGATGRRPRVLSAVYCRTDERLTCVVAAAALEDIHSLFEVALLPPVRVLEVIEIEEDGPRRERG